MAGETVRASLQFDASSYATGYYNYTLTLDAKDASGGQLFTHAVSDHVAVVNRINSEYGNRWWLPFLDRLDLDQATTTGGGVGLIRGDGTSDFFDYQGTLDYVSPLGVFETLTRTIDQQSGNTTGYELDSPDGWTKHFNAAGLLTKVADRNGREETYTYTDADGDTLVDELAGRTDFHGYTETYAYTSGRLSSWSDGHGVTYTYSYNVDGTLDEITGPPAVPGGPTPTISYTYDPTTKLLLTKTDIPLLLATGPSSLSGTIRRALYQGRFKSFPIEEDGHLLTVCRYVERNALRANLVSRAQAWRWSSLWQWNRSDRAVTLDDWPVPRPGGWLEFVNRVQTEKELQALRRSVIRGTPFGSPDWQQSTARQLGLESTLRPRGRPQKRPQ